MKKFYLMFIFLALGTVLAPTLPRAQAAETALPPKFTRVHIGAGLSGPTAMAFAGDETLVTQKTGAIRVIGADGILRRKPFHTLSVNSEGERGLLGIAVDPAFATNGVVYVYYTTGPGAKLYSGTPQNRVSRLKQRTSGKIKEKILLDSIPSPDRIHNGGDIQFGFDGKLYISVGDGGCCSQEAQELDTLHGKILRLNRDGTIPTDNPFYNTPGARKETYAFGFRNPWRIGRRATNQTFLVADVGAGKWEEINSLAAGANYGWPLFEGPCPWNNINCDPAVVNYGATTKPIHWYGHTSKDEKGIVVVGGVFAENSNYPAPYANSYFYADGDAGWVHVLKLNAKNEVKQQLAFDEIPGYPVSFANGPDGNIYVVDFTGGVIHKYVYTP